MPRFLKIFFLVKLSSRRLEKRFGLRPGWIAAKRLCRVFFASRSYRSFSCGLLWFRSLRTRSVVRFSPAHAERLQRRVSHGFRFGFRQNEYNTHNVHQWRSECLFFFFLGDTRLVNFTERWMGTNSITAVLGVDVTSGFIEWATEF